MMPLPKSMLVHTATLYDVTTDNQWQDETLSEGVKISKIRIEPISKLVTSKDNTQITLTAVLFYDCRVSNPKNVEFKHGQTIAFNSREYKVETIEPMTEKSRLHHFEVGLI